MKFVRKESDSILPHLIFDVLQVGCEVILHTVKEALWLSISSAVGKQVNCSQTCLLARGNKDNDRLLWRILADGIVDWLHHSY